MTPGIILRKLSLWPFPICIYLDYLLKRVNIQPYKEWWNFGPNNHEIRCWNAVSGESPYHEEPYAALRMLPGLESPLRARPDQMHIYACGYGKDLYHRVWFYFVEANSGQEDRFKLVNFRAWCHRNRKSTSVKEFSSKSFKCKTASLD